MDYNIEKVLKEDEEAVNKFLQINFFPHEPLNIGLREYIKDNISDESEMPYSIYSNIGNGLSLKAVDKEGNIIGVCMNTLIGNDITKEECGGTEQYNMGLIFDFLDHVDILSNNEELLKKYDNNVMDIKILSVATSQRKKGIGGKLIEESINIARANNVKTITIGCSSSHTACIIEHKFPQFKLTLSYPFRNYKDKDGNTIFKTPEPHFENKTFVYENI